jgi:hypothetical protein
LIDYRRDRRDCVEDLSFDRMGSAKFGMTMSRFVRQSLFASLVAWHAAVMLCGPCLHELAGPAHGTGAVASKGQVPANPAQPNRDATDGCLICHFVAQGQLPVTVSDGPSIQQTDELAVPSLPLAQPLSNRLPSAARAPPAPASNLS